jgi:hypothetical protein
MKRGQKNVSDVCTYVIVAKGKVQRLKLLQQILKSYVCFYQSLCSDRDNSCIFISNGLWYSTHNRNLLLFHDNSEETVLAAPVVSLRRYATFGSGRKNKC